MSEYCTEQQFLSDVATHKLEIVQDNGVYRHLKFRRPGTICYGFDLITWPGELCIRGDMGTYVFNRLQDMFEFFRNERSEGLYINPGYWGEKLQSICQRGGYREFDPEKLKARVKDHFECYFEDCDDEARKADTWEAIEFEVLRHVDDGEFHVYSKVNEFEHEGFTFVDFFDGGGTESYTFHYIWVCYAIAWGIQQYDAVKDKEVAA